MTPSSYNGLPAIMAVLRHCSTHQAWAQADSHWQCQLLAPGMLVQKTGQAELAFCVGLVGAGAFVVGKHQLVQEIALHGC